MTRPPQAPVGPCLGAALPTPPALCQFSSDAVKRWRIPIATMRVFNDNRTWWPHDLSAPELWPAPNRVLARLIPKGQRAVSWLQWCAVPSASELAAIVRGINYSTTTSIAALRCAPNIVLHETAPRNSRAVSHRKWFVICDGEDW